MHGSPQGSPVHGALPPEQVPVPDNTPEEEALLFGTGETPVGQQPNPFAAFGTQGVPTSTPATSSQPVTAPGGGAVGESLVVEMLRVMQQQQRQQEAMMDQYRKQLEQNQQLVATMLRRMDSEEKRRNDAELAAAEAKAKAEAAKASVPSDPFLAATSSTGGSFPSSSPKDTGSSSGGYVSNRADKYLPQLPVIAHQEMGRDRMREIEAWHGFLETMSSWLEDEAYVNELRLCISVKDEIRQDRLPPDTAARSAKLFYLLSQSLAKWERGLELLRSCSKRQSMSATGYEAVRTLHLNYSIVSRMEAVYVRDGCMKLHAQC